MTRPLLLLVWLVATPAWAQQAVRPTPNAEVAWIASCMHADGGAELAYVSSFTSVHVIRERAWILSTYTGDLPRYAAEYLVVSCIDGELTAELLTGPGETRVLEGDAVRTYLRVVNLETTPLEQAFERYYGPPPDDGG